MYFGQVSTLFVFSIFIFTFCECELAFYGQNDAVKYTKKYNFVNFCCCYKKWSTLRHSKWCQIIINDIKKMFCEEKMILRQFWDIFGPKNRSKSPLRNSLRIGFQTHWSTIFQKMNFFTFSWLLWRLRGREFLKMVPFDFYDHFTSNKCQTNNFKALCNSFFRS